MPYIAKIVGHSTIDTLIRNYRGWIDAYTKQNNSKLVEAFRGASIPEPKILPLQKVGPKVGPLNNAFSETLAG